MNTFEATYYLDGEGSSASSLAPKPFEDPNASSAGTLVGVGREASYYVLVRFRYTTINITYIS